MSVTLAAYPMIEEQQATGRVAAVYADMLAQMPMVPSLFKTLALCPSYLVMAWRQAVPALQDRQAGAAGSKLASRVRDAPSPPSDAAVRNELGQFVAPPARMLFIASGLRLALNGEIDALPADAEITPVATAPEPERNVPPVLAVEDSRPFNFIRSRLYTPIVNSLWRHLAGLGLLAQAWDQLGPHAPRAVPSEGPSAASPGRWPLTPAGRWSPHRRPFPPEGAWTRLAGCRPCSTATC